MSKTRVVDPQANLNKRLRKATFRNHLAHKVTTLLNRVPARYALRMDLPLTAWLQHAYRRRSTTPLPLLSCCLSEFLQHLLRQGINYASLSNGAKLELRSTFRCFWRLLSQHQDHCTVSSIIQVFKQVPVEEWNQALRKIASEAKLRVQRRIQAAAKANEVAEYLGPWGDFLNRTIGTKDFPSYSFDAPAATKKYRSMAEAAARSEITAFNNGVRIVCQSVLAPTADRELNSLFFFYLFAHELMHSALGSFAVDFRCPRGRLLKRLTASIRRNSEADLAAVRKRRAKREAILTKEGLGNSLSAVRSTPMIQFFEAFGSHGRLIRHLVNALEDGRIERLFERRFKGIALIHREVQESGYVAEVAKSPLALTTSAATLSRVAMYAARRFTIDVGPIHNVDIFNAASEVIDQYHSREKLSVYDSLFTAYELYQILLPLFPKEPSTRVPAGSSWEVEDFIDEISSQFTDDDLDIGSQRRAIFAKQKSPWENTDDNDPMKTDPNFKISSRGVFLPEWSWNKGKLIERATHVTVRTYETRTPPFEPALPALQFPFPNLRGAQVVRGNGGQRIWDNNGSRIASERYAEYLASVRAGYDLTISYEPQRRNSEIHVTLLLDASITVEAARRSLAGDSALQRMIQLSNWIAAGLSEQGLPCEAFAGVSGGLHLVRLAQLPQPLSSSLTNFRAIGAGGFRLGAMLRALTNKRNEVDLPPVRGPHRVIVLTDGDTKYLNTALESLFEGLWKRNCPGCSTRAACRISHARGALNQRVDSCFLNGNPNHALADIQHAIQSMSQSALANPDGTEALIVAFSDVMNEDQWNNYLAGRWVRAISNEDAAAKVSGFLMH